MMRVSLLFQNLRFSSASASHDAFLFCVCHTGQQSCLQWSYPCDSRGCGWYATSSVLRGSAECAASASKQCVFPLYYRLANELEVLGSLQDLGIRFCGRMCSVGLHLSHLGICMWDRELSSLELSGFGVEMRLAVGSCGRFNICQPCLWVRGGQ
jgi:hypothetical protein